MTALTGHASRGDGRVAVVIPVYRARFLAEALESVFFQTHPPDQVIVVDDGSPDQDDLRRAVAPYAGRITMIHQENQGAGAARNHGIAATTAEFIALLDADDRWLPAFLRDQMQAFASDPGLDLVYSDGLFIGRSPLAGRTFMSACPSRGDVTLEALLAQACTVLLSAVVVRRAVVNTVGGFDPELRRGQDFDLWLRLARLDTRMSYRPAVLTLRRIHDDNLSGNAVNEVERPLRVLEKAIRSLTLTPRQRAIAERRVRELRLDLAREQGKALIERGDFAAARRALRDARQGVTAWKVLAARLGLRVAPHLMRRVYLARVASAES